MDSPVGFTPLSNFQSGPNLRKKAIFVVVVALIVALGIYKKSWFVAATVNGSPITSLELLSKVNKDYGSQVLEQMINEKVILAEARSKNALPTPAEVEARFAEVQESLGGKDNFDNVLSQQGQTRAGVKDQLKVQLAAEKLYSGEISVTAEEIDDFVKNNKESLQAKDDAGQRVEAERALRQRKLSQIFFQKFQELKEKAKITIF